MAAEASRSGADWDGIRVALAELDKLQLAGEQLKPGEKKPSTLAVIRGTVAAERCEACPDCALTLNPRRVRDKTLYWQGSFSVLQTLTGPSGGLPSGLVIFCSQ